MTFYIKEYDRVLWKAAEKRASGMPIYGGSHRGVEANQVGALGEMVFEDFLMRNSIPYESSYETTHDLLVLGGSLEIKTKDRTVMPRPDYDCSVPLYNHSHQIPDRYAFISLYRDKRANQKSIERFNRAVFVGWCTYEKLELLGKRWRAGEVDPANGTKFWTDCLNIRISDLDVPESFFNSARVGY